MAAICRAFRAGLQSRVTTAAALARISQKALVRSVVLEQLPRSTSGPGSIMRRTFCARTREVFDKSAVVPNVVEVDYHELKAMTPKALGQLREAFIGNKAYGAVAVVNIPGYGQKLKKAFRAGIDLALTDPAGRQRAAAVNNTYPGWSGTPGQETHPLQSSFLFNTKQEIPGGKPDPYFGINTFPSEEYRKTWVDFVTPMHDAALDVLKGCDAIIEEDLSRQGIKWSEAGRSLHRIAVEGPALASRFICYDSEFTREDKMLDMRDNPDAGCSTCPSVYAAAKVGVHAGDGFASMLTHSTPINMAGHLGDRLPSTVTQHQKSVGHAGDGLASMRTHSTPVKTAGHAGDGLASMRTHSTPVKSAGHAGDGLASMRTHATPVKSAGHAGDGLASMRTHSTPVKSAGHAGDGLASMRTHSTPVKSAGHAGDGLASMRTHATPVKSAGHAGDGLASMRTHSTPVKSAGHAGDGLASMRTHSTPVKSAGHAGDGLASMRTHATPVKSAGHAGDGLASMCTHATPIKSAGHAGDGLASMRTHATPVKSAGSSDVSSRTTAAFANSSTTSSPTQNTTRAVSTQVMPDSLSFPSFDPSLMKDLANIDPSAQPKEDLGDYWLPWHIDSNFVTVLHRERYADERTAEFVKEPEGAGLLVMNSDGDVTKLEAREDCMLLQMGAFAQIYAGGLVNAARHAVVSPRPPGVARFNFCNFWYVPWNTLCDAPPGTEDKAVSEGWNAMMDKTYLNITMKQGFAAFRQFMTTPEARVQFADSEHFLELCQMFPLPAQRRGLVSSAPEIVVDVMTDVRCPFSFLSQLNLDSALKKLGLHDNVVIRYHPVFLNPNVPKEGESLDDYLLRDYGYTKEYAHSEDYPLRKMGLAAGVKLNPNRRVINTFDAFVLLDAAAEVGKQHELAKAMSLRYFEGAEDISDAAVLHAAAAEAGLESAAVEGWLADAARRARVWEEYQSVSATVGEVPLFVVRERISGNGVEVGGNKSVEEWEGALNQVLHKASFIGMTIPGPLGKEVRLPEAIPYSPVSLAMGAQHGYKPSAWPFTQEDVSRMDESPDDYMYAEPRLVNHLDDTSLLRLKEAYRNIFSSVPKGFAVLDLCSSWVSHYPQELLDGARVAVHGLNQHELWANSQATERHVQDLNADAKLPWEDNSFDFVTMALSIQYMTDPRAVFSEMHRVLKPGGMAVIAHSHKCFIEKAVKLFATETYDGEGHTHTIGRYFQHGPAGGWEHLSAADVSPRHGDPVWLVTAVKAREM